MLLDRSDVYIDVYVSIFLLYGSFVFFFFQVLGFSFQSIDSEFVWQLLLGTTWVDLEMMDKSPPPPASNLFDSN